MVYHGNTHLWRTGIVIPGPLVTFSSQLKAAVILTTICVRTARLESQKQKVENIVTMLKIKGDFLN